MTWEPRRDNHQHAIQIALNLNARKDADPKYYVEKDGDTPKTGDTPDELASALVHASPYRYRSVLGTFGFEAVSSNKTRDKLMSNIVNFLLGPRIKNTKAYSGKDLPYTKVNESKYTNSTFTLSSTGYYPRNTKIANARFQHSNSSIGLKPVIQSGFENFTDQNVWNFSGAKYSKISKSCGAYKGDKALILQSSANGGTAEVTSRSYNVSSSQNLSLEFWVKKPSQSSSCDPAEGAEDLKIQYEQNGGSGWNTLKVIKPGDLGSGEWQKVRTSQLPSSAYTDSFRLRVKRNNSSAQDAYIIDELSLDSKINESRGEFLTSGNVSVKGLVDARKVDYDLSGDYGGLNDTYAVQFKDNSTQGYWGSKTEAWIVVDTKRPKKQDVNISRYYVNDPEVDVRVSKPSYLTDKAVPDLFRFSCNRKDWSRWYVRNGTADQVQIDITNSSLGCPGKTGNRKISTQFRDYAGNLAPTIVNDTVIYDTQKPNIMDIGPKNRSVIKLSDVFELNASDNYSVLNGSKNLGSKTYRNRYDDSSGNGSLEVNTTGGLDPFSSDGDNQTFFAYIFDKALNMRKNVFKYDVDTRAPTVKSVKAGGQIRGNNSAIKSGENLDFAIKDQHFVSATLGTGSNVTKQSKSFTFSPNWSQGYRTLDVWLKDNASNIRHLLYNYTVDDTPPQVSRLSVSNQSYILNTTVIRMNFSDALSGVKSSSIKILDGASRKSSQGSDLAAEINNDTQGEKSFNISLKDRADNGVILNFTYTVDTEPPTPYSTYTNPGWKGKNTSIPLKAYDDRKMGKISYCVRTLTGLCAKTGSSLSGKNVTVDVGCVDGAVCNKSVKYGATDSAGNANASYETQRILIDKKKPEATLRYPSKGSRVAGEVQIKARISDKDSGIKDVNYTVYNASNSSQVFDSGDLNSSNSYSAIWNSNPDISLFGDVKANLTVLDSSGNKASDTSGFRVENSKTSVTIQRPYRQYVNSTIDLSVHAKRPGVNVIESHNYSIYDSNGNMVYSQNLTGIGASNHTFNAVLDSSQLSGDGNYSLKSRALDNASTSANSSTWFYLDTQPPNVALQSSINSSWETGVINVGFTADDDESNGSISVEYRYGNNSWKQGSYGIKFSDSSFDFVTGNCKDSSSNKCQIRLTAKDTAGNSNTSLLRFKVDNVAPDVSIDSPAANTWQNKNFNVKTSISDNVENVSVLRCRVKIEGSRWMYHSCTNDIQVNVGNSERCDATADDHTCTVRVKAIDEVGLEGRKTRNYLVDYKKPRILDIAPGENVINGSRKFNVNFTDDISDVSSAKWNASGAVNTLQNGTKFDPGWTNDGQKQVELLINDTAGNQLKKTYTYTLDTKKPQLEASNLSQPKGLRGDVNIYKGEALYFNANLSDKNGVDSAVVEVNGGNRKNYTMQNISGDNNLWRADIGERSKAGKYNVTAVYITDNAGNTRKVDSGLPKFNVNNYSTEVVKGLDVPAGYRGNLTLQVDLNKTVESKEIGLTVFKTGSDKLGVENFSCSYGGECNATETSKGLDLNVSGGYWHLNVTIDPEAFTPAQDTNVTFRTDLLGNKRIARSLYRAPDLQIANLSCVGSCTVDQNENFSVNLTALNLKSQGNTGKAVDAALKLKNIPDDENHVRHLNNISSGYSQDFTFSNLSIAGKGDYSIEAALGERTGTYNTSKAISIHVKDSEKPTVESYSITASKINLNQTETLKAQLKDNSKIRSANATVVNTTGQEENLTLQKSSSVNRKHLWYVDYQKTSRRGTYNFTKIYVKDNHGNLRRKTLGESFNVSQLEMNATLLQNTTTVGNPVKFSLNITGNSEPVENIEINASRPLGGNTISSYDQVNGENTLKFSRFYNSGNYSFKVKASTGDSTITKKTGNVSVAYGNSSVQNINGNSSVLILPKSASPYNLTWVLKALDGGLRNINLTVQSSNNSVIKPIRASKSAGNLTYSDRRKDVGYLTKASYSTGKANLTFTATPGKGNGTSKKVPVEIVSSDSSSPVLRQVSSSESVPNLNESISFQANVTDNSLLDNVTLEVSHPVNKSSKIQKFSMNRGDDGMYRYRFTNTSEAGNYSFRVTAWDIAGNSDGENGSFRVSDSLNLDVSPSRQIYLTREKIKYNMELRDADGERLNNYDLNAVLSRNGSNVSLANGAGGISAYTVKRSDPPSSTTDPAKIPVDYTLYLNVSKGNNSASLKKTVGVSRLLKPVKMEQPDYIKPGSNFTVKVYWREPGGQLIDAGSFSSFAICSECKQGSTGYQRMDYNHDNGTATATFTAPESGKSVSILLVGSDNRGNSESQDLLTSPPPSFSVSIGGSGTTKNGTGPGRGFSGLPGGGGPRMKITRLSPPVTVAPGTKTVNLSVNTNIAAKCVYSRNVIPEDVSFKQAKSFDKTGGAYHQAEVDISDVDYNTFSYSVMCASDSANATRNIVFSRGNVEINSFNASLPTSLTPLNESVLQYENATARFTVTSKKKSKPLNLQFNFSSSCCNAYVLSNGHKVTSAQIGPQQTRRFKLGVYVPLHTREGTFSPLLSIRSGNASRERYLDFQVLDRKEVEKYKELKQRAQLLNASIKRYRLAGIDTSGERKMFKGLWNSIEDANRSIMDDNLTALREGLNQGYSKAETIDSKLEAKALKKYVLLNWWKYALGFMLLYIAFFLVTVVGIPYYRIQTELVRINSELEDQVEARKKGEKQYFKRQIDKDTFNEMMQDRQNRILELRGEKEDLKDELDGFLWSKLTVQNYLKAPWKGMEELEKWWAANRRARQNIHGEEDQEDEE
ncbi:MAG: hypothetical protein ABEJ87_00270 [Candidatus Nanohalobium sp.]